jgi:hypothetical protein
MNRLALNQLNIARGCGSCNGVAKEINCQSNKKDYGEREQFFHGLLIWLILVSKVSQKYG